MIQFFETKMGRIFFEGNVPQFIQAVNRLAAAIEKSNEIALAKNVTPSVDDDAEDKN